jgi:hypothetical protein
VSPDRSCQIPVIWLLTSVGEQYKPIDTVAGAAKVLLEEWPVIQGRAYLLALQACRDALQGNGPAADVPAALIRAADEAFVSYIRVVGGGKRSRESGARLRHSTGQY